MAVFRENPTVGDRSAEDRRRHRELVEDSIKKNVGGIIAEENIIGSSRDKKIKIPIKSKKEFQFIFGKNEKGVGSGNGKQNKGDVIGKDPQKGTGNGQGAGNEEGEEIYEAEITLGELLDHLFDEMQLPDLDKRKLSDILSEEYRTLGYQRKGIPPRLAKRKSLEERIKRRQGIKRNQLEEELDSEKPDTEEPEKETQEIEKNKIIFEQEEQRFPFREDDLRYRRLITEVKKSYNAVVFCIMDVSGSMDQVKKFLARSFYFLLYQFIRLKYANVEIVFIAHTTEAKEVTEDVFFHRGESGGTKISSGYEKALEIIDKRYNPANWNIYAFHCSDGDNWPEDNRKSVYLANCLCEACNMFGYVEIPIGNYISSTIKSELSRGVKKKNFHVIQINKIEDVHPGLKKLLVEEGE